MKQSIHSLYSSQLTQSQRAMKQTIEKTEDCKYTNPEMQLTKSNSVARYRKILHLSERAVSSRKPINSLLTTTCLFALFDLKLFSLLSSNAQCPANSVTSFERTNNVLPRDIGSLQVLFSAPQFSPSLQGNSNSSNDLGQQQQSEPLFGSSSSQHHNSLSNSLLNISMSRFHHSYQQQANSHNYGSINVPITAECNNRCRRRVKCKAFLVDYERGTCYSLENNSFAYNQQQQVQLIAAGSERKVAFFEKICVSQLLATDCERAWFFERLTLSSRDEWLFLPAGVAVPSAADASRIVEGVTTRLRCEELCLAEREFVCRSGEYDSVLSQCRLYSFELRVAASHAHLLKPYKLSKATARSSQVQDRDSNNITTSSNQDEIGTRANRRTIQQQQQHRNELFENQCVSSLSGNSAASFGSGHASTTGATSQLCDSFEGHDDLDLGQPEIMRRANSSSECQVLCSSIIKAFTCRSFTWHQQTGSCLLSSMNTRIAGGIDKLFRAPGYVYYERGECLDLRLDCQPNAMTLNLRTSERFTGRMYVRGELTGVGSMGVSANHQHQLGCELAGRAASASSASLTIPYGNPLSSASSNLGGGTGNSLESRCFARDAQAGKYSTIVVVQQHPLIQRKSDRFIKLVCDYQASSKTISSSYNVNTNLWASSTTALVNGTSHAPKIKLRITDRRGGDVSGAKLGDELVLRVEADADSPYDMSARSVLAKSGQSRESIALIDARGCPTDARIFPALRRLNRRTLIAKFDAFKFSSDAVVRFEVDVQFCLNRCPQIVCDHPDSHLLDPSLAYTPTSLASHHQEQQLGELTNSTDISSGDNELWPMRANYAGNSQPVAGYESSGLSPSSSSLTPTTTATAKGSNNSTMSPYDSTLMNSLNETNSTSSNLISTNNDIDENGNSSLDESGYSATPGASRKLAKLPSSASGANIKSSLLPEYSKKKTNDDNNDNTGGQQSQSISDQFADRLPSLSPSSSSIASLPTSTARAPYLTTVATNPANGLGDQQFDWQ